MRISPIRADNKWHHVTLTLSLHTFKFLRETPSPIRQHTDMREIGVPNFLSSVSCTKINNFSSTNIKYWERV